MALERSAASTGPGSVEDDPVLSLTPRAEGPFKSITVLVAERRHQEGLQRFRDGVRVLPSASTQTLVLRLATTSDPLMLWAQHLELDRRGVPPCQRWPANEITPQHEFITWLADMLWFAKRNPAHTPRFRGWKGLFDNPPTSAKWHATAMRQFLHVSSRYSVAYWCANGMGLTEPQRMDLMTTPTKAMVAERRQLAPAPFAAMRERLLSHAMQHPDRSGARTPDAVAARRARLLRAFILSGRSAATTAANWRLLTGETMTRQAVAKQVAAALEVLDGDRAH
ncbi:hypothetical protein [Variovorax sp. J22R115]|uniref:hypothetical protein n=1 Tax=Variovorax sp. J22R115 TaxID=3053509 RepID=UPI0025770C29|nr:hypothetical protein [Variovorax sp. J22R115]MDM0049292.1 hypothetical protein [Variovorax sp. J22R115]